MKTWKMESTRDLICLDFDFGSRSYEEEMEHLKKMLSSASDENKERIEAIIEETENNKYKYAKRSKDEIRELFYQNGVDVKYVKTKKDDKGNDIVVSEEVIHYKMLYRNSSKAKLGQVMFINEKLYKKAYNWLTMGLGNKMPYDNAKIVEMSAYAPLTTSTIVDVIHIPVEDILILEDQDSFFNVFAKIVEAEDYETHQRVVDVEKTEKRKEKAVRQGRVDLLGNPIYSNVYKNVPVISKKCIVVDKEIPVKNTLWDGMGIIEDSYFPDTINGMALTRHHFFKMCGFRGHIQQFFKDWCEKTGNDYDKYEVIDMFGISHKLKDIKVITTDNAIKWKKFANLMGNNLQEAYLYWCDKVNENGSDFGLVKTDHTSKLGDVQQMSYQMINTLPCSKEDIDKIAKTSVDYVELLKNNNDEFEKFLRKNQNEINHYEMLANLYRHNSDFANSKWFRLEKTKVINTYVRKLRSGKITVNGDNLTVCGNPYALLLYAVGEDWKNDDTLKFEEGSIQCYTTRFKDGEYLCGFRNPHNSPNNVCHLHNVYSDNMVKYFNFSPNIMAVNCIGTDIQDRCNGCDFDSDFLFVTNDVTMVECAKKCYKEYPTIVNKLKESGLTYENNMMEYARMDNKFSKSKRGIGESSNLAQLALTYYWSNPSKDLYDNFVILSVLAQVVIDGCKREYEVDAITEIERIKKMNCMSLFDDDGDKKDFPYFMKYTKEIQTTKNNKLLPYEEVKKKRDKIKNRINKELVCPMNWLQESLDDIQVMSGKNVVPTENYFIKMNSGKPNARQSKKIKKIVEEYDSFIRKNHDKLFDEDFYFEFSEVSESFWESMNRIKIGNLTTINRLIEVAMEIDKSNNNPNTKVSDSNKYSRRLLSTLYKMNPNIFLQNFVKNDQNLQNGIIENA